MPEYRPIPIGIEDFKELIEKKYYFVDKTLFIKDILDNASKITLFTRPRRFGKTLNMSMLKRYFEKTEEDNSYLFDGLNISEAGERYKSYMGQYPVISISLKGMKQPTFKESFRQFKEIVANEFERHCDLLSDSMLTGRKRKRIQNIIDDTADDTVYSTSLKLLSDCLYSVYKRKVIILIDEYDVPLENAYFSGFYDEMISLIRSAFESALKTNDSLEFAVLTGCLRISKESIFTGLNNLSVYSVMDSGFSNAFGFTENEVKMLLKCYDLSGHFDELKSWYDGYLFGKTEIYNPWSVLKFIQQTIDGSPLNLRPYWINTSSNSIIHDLVIKGDKKIRDDIETLIGGGSIDKPLYDDITYVNMDVKSDYIWSFLLHTGYLKPVRMYMKGIQNYFTAVIPNLEIVTTYENTFRQWFDRSIRAADKSVLFKAVLSSDAKTFQLEVNRWLLKSISYHDGYENFYHGFLVGLLEYSDEYQILSNRENGTGRSDIVVKNVLTYDVAAVIEIKTAESAQDLEIQCKAALEQIESMQYEANLRYEGYSDIVKLGIAFCGKQCMVKCG